MKLFAFALLVFLSGYTCRKREHASDKPAAIQVKMDTTAAQTSLVDFDADIKPILTSHCQPCHFPGGKMYERMPFDKAQTIRDHQAGIFRRIKNEEELKKLRAFLKN